MTDYRDINKKCIKNNDVIYFHYIEREWVGQVCVNDNNQWSVYFFYLSDVRNNTYLTSVPLNAVLKGVEVI